MIAPVTPALQAETKQTIFTLQVVFRETINPDLLPREIAKLAKPRVIFWYIGAYGLKQEGVNFYRKRLAKLLDLSKDIRCYLYDLSSWEAFKKRESRIDRPPDPNVAIINGFAIERIKAISANDFFRWITNEKREKAVGLFSEIVRSEGLYSASANFPPTNLCLGEIFNRTAPMLETQFNRDSSKSYSAVQYVEGIYLIDRLIQDELTEDNRKDIQLAFALPNDENKYYQTSSRSFAADVQTYLELNWGEKLQGRNVCVTFFSFTFGNGMGNRPYNAGNKLVNQLNPKDLGC